jgi:glycosyltransferase involved in cell wall biosynthesis
VWIGIIILMIANKMLNQNIKISFIIPVYNAEKYLAQCVDSILNQSYSNLEVILVDDGSTDSSGSICDNYANQYSTVKTIHKKNGGVASTRNTGIKEASGDYIFFIDNDDWIDGKIMSGLVDIIKKTNVDVIINKYYIVGNNEISRGNEFIKEEFINNKSLRDVLTYFKESRINLMAPWEYVIKRSIIVDNNLFFNTDQNGVDDSCFTPILFCHCKSFYLNNEPIYYWRQRSDSQGSTHKKHEYILKMISVVTSLNNYLKSINEDYRKDYIYFSMYKNIFSVVGEYYNYSNEDKKFLSRWCHNNRILIKEASVRSGLFHRSSVFLFGIFWGPIISYNLAKFKGRFFMYIFKTTKNNS